MIAYAMNGEQLPLLNGFPLRLVVPGWYSTYWVKMLNDIEVLDAAGRQFLDEDGLYDPRHAACRHEAGPDRREDGADQPDGAAFLLHQPQGRRARSRPAHPVPVRGIAFGGDSGVARVDFSADGGKTWQPAATRHGRGQIQLPPVAARSSRPARQRQSDADGPLHQHRGRSAAGRTRTGTRPASCATSSKPPRSTRREGGKTDGISIFCGDCARRAGMAGRVAGRAAALSAEVRDRRAAGEHPHFSRRCRGRSGQRQLRDLPLGRAWCSTSRR